MKLLTKIIMLVLIIGSCNYETLPINSGELYKIANIESSVKGDTVFITFQDNSWIYDKNYNQWKSNVLIFLNREKLSQFKYIKTVSRQDKRDFEISVLFTQEELRYLEISYEMYPLLYDFASHVVREFDITEWQSLRSAVYEFDRAYKDSLASTPIDLIESYAKVNSDSLQKSKPYKRMALIGEMVNDIGTIEDAWTEKQIPATQFLSKYEYFFTHRNIKVPYIKK